MTRPLPLEGITFVSLEYAIAARFSEFGPKNMRAPKTIAANARQ